jgi:hypothetical protein
MCDLDVSIRVFKQRVIVMFKLLKIKIMIAMVFGNRTGKKIYNQEVQTDCADTQLSDNTYLRACSSDRVFSVVPFHCEYVFKEHEQHLIEDIKRALSQLSIRISSAQVDSSKGESPERLRAPPRIQSKSIEFECLSPPKERDVDISWWTMGASIDYDEQLSEFKVKCTDWRGRLIGSYETSAPISAMSIYNYVKESSSYFPKYNGNKSRNLC